MKEPKIIKPLDVRVFGNVMTHKTSKEGFINYYSDVTYKGKSEIKSLEKNVFTLTPLGRETYMTAEITNPSGGNQDIKVDLDTTVAIVCNLTTKDDNGNFVPVVNHQVYIAVDTIITDQQLTNENGRVTFNYICSTSGKHHIKFYTRFEDGYRGTEKSVYVSGFYKTVLTLDEKETRTSHTQPVNIKATLKTVDGAPIRNAKFHLYENNNEIKECYDNEIYKTDATGSFTFPFQERKNFNANVNFTDINFPDKVIQHQTTEITGKLIETNTGNPAKNQLISLYLDYNTPPISETRTGSGDDDAGTFTIPFTIDDNSTHIMFITNNRDSNSITSTGKLQYGTDVKKYSFQAVPVPTVEIVPSVNNIIPGQPLEVSVTVADEDASFKDDKVIWYYSLDNKNDWKVLFEASESTLNSDNVAKTKFTYTKKCENFYLKCTYQGNQNYGQNDSNILNIHYLPENVNVNLKFDSNQFTTETETKIFATFTDSANNPIPKYDIKFYEYPREGGRYNMSMYDTRYLGVAKTDSKGVATILYTPRARGNWDIKAVYELSINTQKFDSTSTQKSIFVDKRTRKMNLNIPYSNNEGDDVKIEITVTDRDTDEPIANDTVTIVYQQNTSNATKITQTLTTNSNGIALLTISKLSIGTYTVTASLPSIERYYALNQQKSFKVSKKEIPTFSFSNIRCMKGETIATEIKAPSDYTGKIELKNTTTGKVFANYTFTSDDQGTAIVTTTITEEVGEYSYILVYEGNEKYMAGSTTTTSQLLQIYGSFTIDCKNADSSKLIEAKRLTNLVLYGYITNIYNQPYTGTIECRIRDEFYGTFNVSEGYFGKDKNNTIMEGTNINIDSAMIQDGKNDLLLICKDSLTGTITESKYTLNVTKQDSISLWVAEKESVVGEDNEFKCYYPLNATGKIVFYETDKNGTHVNETPIATLNAIDGTQPANTTQKSIKKSLDYFGDRSGGEYYYTAKLIDDPGYVNFESQPAKYSYHTKATIAPGSTDVRAKENDPLILSVTVKDTLNKAFTGVLYYEIDYNGSITEGSINITNGQGSYNIPTSYRQYIIGNNTNITKLTWKYISTASGLTDTQLEKINTDVETRMYNQPSKLAGYFVNESSNFNNAQFKETVQSTNHTDLFTFYSSVTSASNSSYKTVYKYKNTKQFRIHAVISVFPNSTDITDSGGPSSSRLTLVKNAITKVLTDYPDTAGICLDYCRYRSGQNVDKDKINKITEVIRELTNLIKQLEIINGRSYIITSTVSPEIYTTDEALKCNAYNQSYKEFSLCCDFVMPMLYPYDYISNYDGTTFYQMLDKFKKIITMSGKTTSKNNMIGILQTYHGDNHPGTKTAVKELIYNTMAMYMLAENGYLYFRSGLTNGIYSTPSQVYRYTSNKGAGADNKVERDVLIKLDSTSTTFSKNDINTGGLKFSILDTYGGYVTGGTATVFIDGKSCELLNPISPNAKTSLPIVDTKPMIFKIKDITSITTGQHTLKIGYNGNKAKGINGGSMTTTVTFTT